MGSQSLLKASMSDSLYGYGRMNYPKKKTKKVITLYTREITRLRGTSIDKSLDKLFGKAKVTKRGFTNLIGEWRSR